MAQTQRRPVPLTDSGELDTALAFLDFNRESVLKKTGGLDEEQLRRVLVPTGTNPLGLVKHLAAGEDSIDDMDVLRHGAIGVPFGGACALSTLGLHLRCYTWGNVTQLEKAGPTRRPQAAAA
jgi:hypothetical protein